MGTYVSGFKAEGCQIPEHKKQEFVKRIEKLFQAGGMMEVEIVRLLGKKVATIRKAKMHESGMDFYYNYFEDNCWENAGFSLERCCVWSNKVGWGEFCAVVVAAYVLEDLYTNGISCVVLNEKPIKGWDYVGWINFLFDEKYHLKNFDSWKLAEAMHDIEDTEFYDYEKLIEFDSKRYRFISSCEIYAVQNGTKDILEKFGPRDEKTIEGVALLAIRNALASLERYTQESKDDRQIQLQKLMNAIQLFYESDADKDEEFCYEDKTIEIMCQFIGIADAPAVIIKAIAEAYQEDFWALWEKVRNVVSRRREALYGNKGYYVLPISTADFFRLSPDDMIPYWEENCGFEFSNELNEWFEILRNRYDTIYETEFAIENPLRYILEIMEEAENTYYGIYTFSDFFEETIGNLNDKRYLALWKLYDAMLHEPELKEAGSVIFVPDGPGSENKGIYDSERKSGRRLIYSWDILDKDKKGNKARVTFRRYMALAANRKLRCKVFGF